MLGFLVLIYQTTDGNIAVLKFIPCLCVQGFGFLVCSFPLPYLPQSIGGNQFCFECTLLIV